MAEFSSPKELKSFITQKLKPNIDTGRVVDVRLSDENITDRKTVYELRVEVEGSRQDFLELIYNLLQEYNYKATNNYKDRSYRSSIGTIEVPTGANTKGKPINTFIVVKLTVSSLMIKDMMFNVLLLKLPNFNAIKYSPDSSYEFEIIRDFNRAVMKYGEGDPVTVVIKNKYFRNIIGMISGPPGAKADLILVNRQGGYEGFLSHKHGNTTEHFQQYGGISLRSGLYDDKEVKLFRNDVVSNKDEVLASPVFRKIRDVSLKNKAVFGSDYNRAGPASVNNIDFLAQGRITITPINNSLIQIGFTTKLVHRGELSRLSSEYDPVLGARRGEAGRRIEGDSEIVYGIRGGIFPEQYITARKNSKEI